MASFCVPPPPRPLNPPPKRRSRKPPHPPSPSPPSQENLEAALRAFRKQEAAKTGKPAFIVFGDAVIASIVLANPQNLTELQTVKGLGPAKIEQYGAHIIAICRNPDQDAIPVHTAPKSPKQKPLSSLAKGGGPPVVVAPPRQQWINPNTPNSTNAQAPVRLTEPKPADPARTLNPTQQALELRLRDWRKLESEKIGLPQFFVLGTSALHTIALETPTTLDQLKKIPGIDSEKLTRFGPAILAVCAAV